MDTEKKTADRQRELRLERRKKMGREGRKKQDTKKKGVNTEKKGS